MTIDSEKGEHLSSFLDGELDRDHCESLISSICKDEDMKSCLERYQMISDSMKNQLPDGIKHDFVHCVMNVIESEPTTFAPAAVRKSSSSQTGLLPSVKKKVAGFAIAASVATVAVIGVQSQNNDPASQVVAMPENSEFVRLPQSERPMTASVNPIQDPRQATPRASTASSSINSQSVPQLKPVRKFDPILQQYIVKHSQYASGSGVNDIFSHARIVASTNDKQMADQGQR